MLMAQEDTAARAIIAVLTENLPEDELAVLTGRLAFYKAHPIDLNHAAPDQLKDLGFLSALQINNFFIHAAQGGKMLDLLELQGIDGFDLETITRLLPFVTLRAEPVLNGITLRNLRKAGENELILRYGQTLEKQKGFRDLPGSHYAGSPAKLLLRYQYRLADKLSFSFLGEKDAGESFLKGNNRLGADFYSASLALFKVGRFRKIVLGDYSLQFGEGLTLWTGTSFGRGADVAGVAKNGSGLKPYTSANESLFFRGLGTQLKLTKNIDLTTFISSRNLDASLGIAADGSANLSTINVSGLHRTATEIAHKQNLRQLFYGAFAVYHTERLNTGIAAYHSSYEYPFITGKPLYKKYAFQGKELSNLGLNYSYTFKNIYLFGELAKSLPGGGASLNGAMASLSSKLSFLLLFRDYSKEHINFYSQALGQGTDAGNEKGFYEGVHFSPTKKWDFSLYSDLFIFPWARYRTDLPSGGSEVVLTTNFSPRKTLKFTLKISSKKSAQNDTSGLPVNPVAGVQKTNLRAGVQWRLNKKLNLENRAEFTAYKKGSRAKEFGYLVYQDLDYHPLSSKVSANMRLAYFNTFSYDSRIYAYEDDVLHGSGSGLYNGSGLRGYLNFSYKVSRQLRTWLRYAVSYYPGEETNGSGLDQIEGNKKSDIKIQLRYKF